MSEADRQAYEKRKAVRRDIAKRVAAMSQAERELMAAKSGLRMITGHELSTFNTCFVLHQDEQATVLGGFNQWREAGRKVRKGGHSVAIWRPIGEQNKDTGETIVDPDDKRFALISIFDISQTEELRRDEASGTPLYNGETVTVGRVNVLALAESEVPA
jgi:hypothetical protein